MGRLAPHSAPEGYSLPGSGIRVAVSCFRNNYFHLKGRHFFHVRFSERLWFHNRYENTVWKNVGTTFQYLVFVSDGWQFRCFSMHVSCVRSTCNLWILFFGRALHTCDQKNCLYRISLPHVGVAKYIYIYTHKYLETSRHADGGELGQLSNCSPGKWDLVRWCQLESHQDPQDLQAGSHFSDDSRRSKYAGPKGSLHRNHAKENQINDQGTTATTPGSSVEW